MRFITLVQTCLPSNQVAYSAGQATNLIVASDAELTNRQIFSLVNLTKRFDVAVRLFSNTIR